MSSKRLLAIRFSRCLDPSRLSPLSNSDTCSSLVL